MDFFLWVKAMSVWIGLGDLPPSGAWSVLADDMDWGS